MKSFFGLPLLAALTFLFIGFTAADAQTARQTGATPDQWNSHQMNQPPPTTNPKNAFSDKLVEEIRQLYLQAKKEQDAKSLKAQDQKK